MNIFTIIGMATTAWFLVGIAILCSMKIHIPDNCPIGPRLRLMLTAAFHLPYILFTMGVIPKEGGIMESDPSECDCPRCRARRGE